jgi:hypothetical protein
MSREEISQPKKYYSIVQGTFRTQVPQDHPEAVRRDWTSADGKSSGTKYERVIRALYGYITDISFADTEYGTQIFIKLDKNVDGEEPTVALNIASREAEDLMKKLPNVDFSKEVQLRPYSFDGREGDEVRGMSVMQADEFGDFKGKIVNYFFDFEAKKNINGFPIPDGDVDQYMKDDWKIYFLRCRKFLVQHTKDVVIPRLGVPSVLAPTTPAPKQEAFGSDPDAIDKAWDEHMGPMPVTP